MPESSMNVPAAPPALVRRAAVALAAAWLSLTLGGCAIDAGARDDGMTREQGDAILAELRDIKRVLAEQQRAKPAEGAREPRTAKVRAEGGPTLGAADAPVTLVEYTDFQCPFCRRHHDGTFAEIRKKYVETGKVRYVVRDLPLSFHEHAQPAAIAARCAGEQGRFWDARDALFAAQPQLSDARIRTTVLGLGLDAAKYDACVKNPATLAAVRADADEAAAAGVSGTPGFVIGRASNGSVEGTVVSGAQPFPAFAQRIDALLAAPAPR
jgi:protein-disulfide isomerase